MSSKGPGFEISQVALLLSMPLTRVKNWTIGRPLTIKPSIRRGKGAGTANLYGPTDVFLFAVVQQMSDDGLGMEVVEEVLKVMGRAEAESAKYLLISRPTKGAPIERKRALTLATDKEMKAVIADADLISIYILNLQRIRDRVMWWIQEEMMLGNPAWRGE